VLDERVDQFSDLVDSNLETLRRATQDNREVFVSVLNKTNEMHEQRYNGFIDDLEMITGKMDEIASVTENSRATLKNDQAGLAKAVTDLEAHINTSILTEKSVRKA
jgi:hypothetical protein